MAFDRLSIPLSADIQQPTRLAFKHTEDQLGKLVESLNTEIARIDTDVAGVSADVAAIGPASDGSAGLIEIAVQSDIEAATALDHAVPPGRMHFHPGVAKCWSVVTNVAGVHALAASRNITSITDGATGIHTVTIATDFSSANWCCQVSAEGAAATFAAARHAHVSGKVVGSVVIATISPSAAALADATSISMVGYGDHA